MPTYGEKLQHPRWQEKRLRILQRENFTCEECETKDKPLHVHHGYYRPWADQADPWDYEDETLHVLCRDCHERVDRARLRAVRALGYLTEAEMCEAVGYLLGLRLTRLGPFEIEALVLPQLGCMAELLVGLRNGTATMLWLTEAKFHEFIGEHEGRPVFFFMDAAKAAWDAHEAAKQAAKNGERE